MMQCLSPSTLTPLRKKLVYKSSPELASGNNQTVPEFLREKPELLSWIAQPLQELIANKNLMDKLSYVPLRNAQQPQANDNPVENLTPSVPSQGDSMNDNDVNQLVGSTAEVEQPPDAGESSRHRVRTMETTFMRIALLLATVELIHMARKERSTSTSATRKPVGTIVEYFGLASAVWQCVYSTVEYIYTRQGKDNPIKMYLLPLIFLLCVVISKLLIDKRSIDKSS
ncbi:uncharacterized protein [Populus alba]|uniref:uncharacterized protein isoform X2 n=1 Tax=Populus alba TaxID=43335 RepID=UPI003CC6F8E2